MSADLTRPFSESCCEGGACGNDMSAQSCGCDKGIGHTCERHTREKRALGESMERALEDGFGVGLDMRMFVEQSVNEDLMRDTIPAMGAPVAEYRDVRTFDSGATRNIDHSKYDYEAFINPEALHTFAEYMHTHRRQRDGSLRDGDNWQKGIPFRVYVKSLVRHSVDLWRMERGYPVTNPDTGQPHTKQELCCAIVFNSMGYLKELIDPSVINVQKKSP